MLVSKWNIVLVHIALTILSCRTCTQFSFSILGFQCPTVHFSRANFNDFQSLTLQTQFLEIFFKISSKNNNCNILVLNFEIQNSLCISKTEGGLQNRGWIYVLVCFQSVSQWSNYNIPHSAKEANIVQTQPFSLQLLAKL